MALVTLDEAKEYLRVDTGDEDALVGTLLSAAERLCVDVARMTESQWAAVNATEADGEGSPLPTDADAYTEGELAQIRPVMRVAVLYALGYLYEHREEADHRALTLTLRSLLFGIREGAL